MKEIKVTEEMMNKLIATYEGNKEDLSEIEEYLEHDYLDDGVSNVNDTFEMGYNNALEYVFKVLGIEVPGNTEDDDIEEDEEEYDCEEICGNCDCVNGFNYEENGSMPIICEDCGEEIILCSLCDPDEADCDKCPYYAEFRIEYDTADQDDDGITYNLGELLRDIKSKFGNELRREVDMWAFNSEDGDVFEKGNMRIENIGW